MPLFLVSTCRLLALSMVALLAITSTGWAQEASLKRADVFFEAEDYHSATTQYEQILKDSPQSGIAQFKAGVCYLYTGHADKGLAYIKESAQKPLAIDPYYYFWLGKAYHLNMRIDSALIAYRKYLKGAPTTDAFRKGTENLIAQAHRTESYFTSTDASPLQARNLGEIVNSPFTERNPQITPDGKLMIFSTRRPVYPEELQLEDGEFAEKSFITVRGADGAWTRATPLLAPADRKTWYTAVQLLENGQRLLLLREGKEAGFFVATRSGDTFDAPMPIDLGLKVSVTEYDVTFSPNLKSAVYSRMNRTTGNLDLYGTRKEADGSWSKSVRLPSSVNSLEDEVSPEFRDNGRILIFASKGREGMGGFDLYKATWDEVTQRWSFGDNIGLPYNSPGNDIGYEEVSVDAKRYVYISSSRPRGFGEADIYEVDFTGVQAGIK